MRLPRLEAKTIIKCLGYLEDLKSFNDYKYTDQLIKIKYIEDVFKIELSYAR